MAFTVNDGTRCIAEFSVTNVSPDAVAVDQATGAIVTGEVEITSYTTGGETFQAGDLSLSLIYGAFFWSKELAAASQDVNSIFVPAGGVAASSGVLHLRDQSTDAAAAAEVADTTDVGVWQFIAFGERRGATENT